MPPYHLAKSWLRDRDTLDAIALLRADHRKVEDLFAEFKAPRARPKNRPWGMTISPNPYRGFRFPSAVIEHAVWLYHCFSLSLRDVELILPARGIVVCYDSNRKWSLRFGRIFANALKRRRPQPGDKWYTDEGFIRIRGKPHYLWRAVDRTEMSSTFWSTAGAAQPRPRGSSASC
jgi:hypothetical protein